MTVNSEFILNEIKLIKEHNLNETNQLNHFLGDLNDTALGLDKLIIFYDHKYLTKFYCILCYERLDTNAHLVIHFTQPYHILEYLKQENSKLYKDIKSISDSNKILNTIYSLDFKLLRQNKPNKPKYVYPKIINKSFDEFCLFLEEKSKKFPREFDSDLVKKFKFIVPKEDFNAIKIKEINNKTKSSIPLKPIQALLNLLEYTKQTSTDEKSQLSNDILGIIEKSVGNSMQENHDTQIYDQLIQGKIEYKDISIKDKLDLCLKIQNGSIKVKKIHAEFLLKQFKN